jgi:membrane protein YdbS with pleckstrin-like domain
MSVEAPPLPYQSGLVKPLPRTEAARPVDPEERDIWYGGYAGRTMLPEFAGCLIFTLGSVVIRWWLGSRWPQLAEPVGLAVLVLASSLWLFVLFRWSYRLAAFQYRLTNRRLFVTRGFLYDERGEWNLAEVSRVEVGPAPLTGCLGASSLRLYGENSLTLVLELPSVKLPRLVAETLREQIAHAAAARLQAAAVSGHSSSRTATRLDTPASCMVMP